MSGRWLDAQGKHQGNKTVSLSNMQCTPFYHWYSHLISLIATENTKTMTAEFLLACLLISSPMIARQSSTSIILIIAGKELLYLL